MHKLGNFLTIGGLVGVTVASGAVLSMSTASATGSAVSDSKSSTASVTVANSCSMTANVTTEHNATLPNGIWSGDYTSGSTKPYENGIGSTTIETFCNDPAGFSIYAIGFTGDSIQGRNTVLHNSSLATTYDIATGTAKSGDTSNWSMKLAAVERTVGGKSLTPSILSDASGSFTDYHAVPSNYTKVASFGTTTGAKSEGAGYGSAITTTYAAYVSGTQPAGTYTGKVKYTLVHPTGAPDPTNYQMQNVATWGNSVNVGDEIVVTDARDGTEYTVARLCVTYSGDNCTTSQLWMTQNLDYKIIPTTPLTSESSDLNTAYAIDGTTLLAGYSLDSSTGIITWSPDAARLTNPATLGGVPSAGNNSNFVSGWTNTQVYPFQAEGQNRLTGEELYIYSSGTTDNDTIYGTFDACTTYHSESDCKHYKIGNYYNWTASVAMNNTSLYGTDEGDIAGDMYVMPNSICPKGWRLPNGITDANNDGTGDTMSDFNKIFLANGITNSSTVDNTKNWVNVGYTANGFTNIRAKSTNSHGNEVPLYFVRSGRVDGSALNYVATYGLAWSSTVKSSDYGYLLYFHSGGLHPATQYYRNYGFPVRCVAR